MKTLNFWPAALPIVVKYGGSPELDAPTLEDEDNIMAAMKQAGRVSSISLTVTRSLRERFRAIEGPFPELEDLVLLFQDGMQMTLPSTSRGPRLCSLHSTRIAFPPLLQLLYSSKRLVDLRLHNLCDSLWLSQEALADALAGMSQLRALSVHFLPTASSIEAPSPAGERVVLPVLTRLAFRGMSEYLEGLVVRIHAARLEDIDITFFDDPIFGVANLSNFFDRIQMQKLHGRAEALFSEHAISISLIQPGRPMRPKLRISIRASNLQLRSMIRLCNCLAPFLSSVEDLRIHTRLLSGQDNSDCERWAELLRPFWGAERFHIAGNLSSDAVLSLQLLRKRHDNLLPLLDNIYIWEPEPHFTHLHVPMVSAMASRWLPGYFIGVQYERTNDLHSGTAVQYQHRYALTRWNRTFLSASDDRCALRRRPYEHISSLYLCISPILG